MGQEAGVGGGGEGSRVCQKGPCEGVTFHNGSHSLRTCSAQAPCLAHSGTNSLVPLRSPDERRRPREASHLPTGHTLGFTCTQTTGSRVCACNHIEAESCKPQGEWCSQSRGQCVQRGPHRAWKGTEKASVGRENMGGQGLGDLERRWGLGGQG